MEEVSWEGGREESRRRRRRPVVSGRAYDLVHRMSPSAPDEP